jgi:4-hydroxybenzoate polyprenyltransferase
MIDATLTYRPPLWRRLAAWAAERFPARNGIFILVVSALGVLFGFALTHDGTISLPAVDLLAFPALWAYFLMLRVFDEHKDYALDLRNHPDRVLQSGQVTLANLRALGWAAAALQLATCLLVDHGVGRVTAMWALLMCWTLLMLKEFFVEWPPRRFVLYAFMHMLAMPLTLLWLAQIGAGGRELTPGVRWLAALGGLIGAALEVARKFRAPGDERDTIETYTRQLGVGGASLALGVIVAGAAIAGGALLAATVPVSPLLYLVLALSAAPGMGAAWRFWRDPTAPRAEAVEALAGASVLLLCVVAIVALLVARGVA